MDGEYYKIGDIAKITGLSLQTIRRYEEAGILHVVRDENTGYRYYHAYDAAILIRIRMYRNSGFSIQDIVEMFKNDLDKQKEIFTLNKENLETKIVYLNKLLECMNCQLNDMQELESNLDIIKESEREEWLGLIYRSEEHINNNHELLKVLKTWIDHVPLVQQLYIVEKDDFIKGNNNYAVGVSVKKEYADFLKLPMHPSVRYFPLQPVLTLNVEAKGEFSITDNIRNKINDYLAKHKMVIDGPILSRTITSDFEGVDIKHFQKIYIPIKILF